MDELVREIVVRHLIEPSFPPCSQVASRRDRWRGRGSRLASGVVRRDDQCRLSGSHEFLVHLFDGSSTQSNARERYLFFVV